MPLPPLIRAARAGLRSLARIALLAFLSSSPLSADNATFYRAINLNGPELVIDGRKWEAGASAANLAITGKSFENQAVALKPATDPARARMIRSSVWGSKVELELKEVPPGDYQILLYVWEDNHDEQFDLWVNDQVVLEKFHSGTAGAWRKLGPWKATTVNRTLKVSARGPGHGAANVSGLEVWAGLGAIPEPERMGFVTELTADQTEFFERKVRPVLAENCFECHRAGAKKVGGGLLLDSRAGVMKGGDGGPVITPGDPEASLLIQAIRHTDPSLTMPPKSKLSPEEIANLETWVRMGAPDPRTADTVALVKARSVIDWNQAREWWSFRPLQAPPAPPVKEETWPRNDLDRFILNRLEKENLPPSADAEKGPLLRRATFDLTGLPPSPAEVEAFLADSSPDAFEKVVERLLASPAYGERWGRHWLDVVRYADTAGDNSDFPIPQMHRYRDWVIQAFNRDLPYDQFIRQQLAGDLMPGENTSETHDRLIATGYIANARRFGSRVEDYPQHLTIEDTIDNVGRSFLGLTLGCARCHDHKFDPIPSSDYYALYGIFQSTRYPWPGIELEQKQRDLVPLVEPSRLAEAEALRNTYDNQKRGLEKKVQKLKDSLKEFSGDEKKKVEAQIKQAELDAKEFVRQGLPFQQAYAVAEASPLKDAAIQMKGDPAKPGDLVPRGFLTVLGGQKLPATSRSSGRRELADWIATPTNPLVARVMVNRIWLHHFGKGLVTTPNDFGHQGKPPTHPELLEWLAARFIASGWSIKSMHRVIMLSHTYRLQSARSEPAVERDPGNELLSSFPRRRLDAESIRDSLLAVAGTLERSTPGAHPFPDQSEWKFTQHNPFKAVYDSKHRSVYLMTQRIQRHPYLSIFDGADPSASTPVRGTSTTPLQALFLLNDKFVHDQSQAFAARIAQASDSDPTRLAFAYQVALGRKPDADETARGLEFLQQARTALASRGTAHNSTNEEIWRPLARVLLRLNEFVYVD